LLLLVTISVGEEIVWAVEIISWELFTVELTNLIGGLVLFTKLAKFSIELLLIIELIAQLFGVIKLVGSVELILAGSVELILGGSVELILAGPVELILAGSVELNLVAFLILDGSG